MKINIFLYLIFNYIYGINEETINNLLLTNFFTVENITNFNNGINNTFGAVDFKGNIIINSDNITIGNNQNTNQILINGLPLGSPNITLPLKYLMVGESSNEIYIGTSSSPLPPPDYISIDNLTSNTIIANRNTNKLTFNNDYNSDLIIGNAQSEVIFSADIVYFNNNQFTQLSALKNSPFLTYLCPVNFNDSVTFNSININGDLNCINTNPITIITKSISYNGLNLSNAVVIGSDNLLDKIEFNGFFTGNSNHIILGSADCLINQITNLPIINNNKNFLYYINENDSNTIYISDLTGFNQTINFFYTDSVEVNFINNNNTANTILQSNTAMLLGSVTINSDFKISNTEFNEPVFFGTVAIQKEIPFYFIGEKNINIASNNIINVNNTIFNDVLFFSQNNITNKLQTAINNIDYLSVNNQGKVCIDPFIHTLQKIKNDVAYFQDIANSIEKKRINIKKKIKKNKKINNKIKKLITLLNTHYEII
jgi:hypothetical protein